MNDLMTARGDLLRKLLDAMGAPKHVIAFNLRASARAETPIIEVDITYYPETRRLDDENSLIEVVGKFKLVPRE